MIELRSKAACVGCEACVQVCVRACITLIDDSEGFLYPFVDVSMCNNCGLCEHVCPVIHQSESRVPLAVYGGINKDDKVRSESSSGGIFSLFAELIISEGGVVFGAKFSSNWEVIHAFTETKEGLGAFRGSKYVQSRIGDSFLKVKTFLKQNRKVLFCGTPCQIAGLKRYLGKESENLLTVDFICHGVPSPLVWSKYLDEISGEGVIRDIRFRDKTNGWKLFSFAYAKEVNTYKTQYIHPLTKNIFLRGFLKDLYLRPSCHQCPAKSLKGGSDITLADFWGMEKEYNEMDDDRGCSVVLINNQRGTNFYSLVENDINRFVVDYEIVKKYNSAIDKSVKPHKKREYFFMKISSTTSLSLLIQKCIKISLTDRIRRLAIRGLKKVLLKINQNR